MRWLRRLGAAAIGLLATCGALWPAAAQAQAEKRVALVIGNAAYRDVLSRSATNDEWAATIQIRKAGIVVAAQENMTQRTTMDLHGAMVVLASSSQPVITPAPGQIFRDCPACPELVVIPAGTFTMGSSSDDVSRYDVEGPQHLVSVHGFALGKFEVTRREYGLFVGETGHAARGGCSDNTSRKLGHSALRDWRNPGFAQGESDPVVCVNWDDAKAYAEWLSRKTGKGYRLPSESEWEYAARARTTSARFWGEDELLACGFANVRDRTGKPPFRSIPFHWCDDNQRNTAPVGSYRANGFGLHDMLGNVGEWTEDCWNESYDGAPRDGSVWTLGKCSSRVVRGGSWDGDPRVVRNAFRLGFDNSFRGTDLGFRVARTL